jgi:hypothetical protein
MLGDAIFVEYDRVDVARLWHLAESVLGPIEETLDAAVASSGRNATQ